MIDQVQDRDDYVQKIVKSDASKKLIVAGPGTGKTHTFKQILYGKDPKKNLVMTFINKLTDDLKCDLHKWAKVMTFHKYSLWILKRIMPDWITYPQVIDLICYDLRIKADNVKNLFHNMISDDVRIKCYLTRSSYYRALSFNDAIYRVVTQLKLKNELPIYENILIDEFQDFSILEVELIKQLENHGNIIIVGDDDQAVYQGKSEPGRLIKEFYKSGDYEIFELPYCNRCPKVIVDIVNEIIFKAVKKGHLKDRIHKPFTAFEIGNEILNSYYPKINVYKMKSLDALSYYLPNLLKIIIDKEIDDFNAKDSNDPIALVIGGRHFLREIDAELSTLLPDRYLYKKTEIFCYHLYDAYKYLLEETYSNLGWRIIMEIDIFEPREKRRIIKKSLDNIDLEDLLPKEYIKKHKLALDYFSVLYKTKQNDLNAETNLKLLIGDCETCYIIDKCVENEESDSCSDKIPILLTSFQGCKGLAADYVFIIGFNNGVIPYRSNMIKDIEICELIVALTRTRKECYLMSVNNYKGIPQRVSSFASWIPNKYKKEFNSLSINDVKDMIKESLEEDQNDIPF